jgi:hypothetical protein
MPQKNNFTNSILFGYAVVKKLLTASLDKVKLILFYQRAEVVRLFADSSLSAERPRLLITIAHITSLEEASDQRKAAPKVARLTHTIDGLLTSFAHCDAKIVVYTLPQRHITPFLPQYQLDRITVQEVSDCDPMYIGFRAQDELASQVNHFDWFMFIEDDIVIHDSLFLEKVAAFHRAVPRKNVLLFPNRYEMYEGNKSYIDLTIDGNLAWNRVSSLVMNGIKLAECTNSHSGIYCLSRAQMHYWIRSGRNWKNRSIMVGPLETAATYCLLECFDIYKPHPQNLHFLEVRHFDTKYSKLLPEPSRYVLSAVTTSP